MKRADAVGKTMLIDVLDRGSHRPSVSETHDACEVQ